MTHQKILTMLAGCSSQKPMPFTDLVNASGLLPATLLHVLGQMAHSLPATINCASITKNGTTQMVYWPTGVVEKSTGHIVINRKKATAAGFAAPARQPLSALRPQASTVQPSISISAEEASMSAAPGKLNIIIFNKVAEQPGITQDELIKFALQQSPESTEKQAIKTLMNLLHSSKKIRSEGRRYKFTYYVNADVKQPAATPAKKITVNKALEHYHSEPVASVSVPHPLPSPLPLAGEGVVWRRERAGKPSFMQRISSWLKPVAAPVTFTLLLTDDNCLHLVIDDDLIMLTPEQTGRLKTFMDRITLKGARA
jgi:hypothetical protein